MAFDGLDFVGLDADILGDGDTDTQAVDVYVAQRLRANQYFLNAGRSSVARSYFNNGDAEDDDGAYAGERAICGMQPSYPIVIPIKLKRGLNAVTLNLLYNVNDQGVSGGGVDYSLQLRDRFRNTIQASNGTLTNAADGYTIQEARVTIRGYADTEGLGEVVFRIQSQDAGAKGSSVTITSAGGPRWVLSSAGSVFNASTSPATNDPSIEYLQSDDTGIAVDIFGVDDTGSKGSGNDIIFPDREGAGPELFSGAFSLRRLTYLQIRSISVGLEYEEDRFGRVGLGNLQAKQTIKGPTTIGQAEAINQFDRAPKLVSWGPGDYTDARQQASWATDIRLKWPIAIGDGAEDTIIDDTILATHENPSFEILMYVIATVEVSAGLSVGVPESAEGKSDWIFDVTAEQFDTADSDWTTPISLGTSQTTQVGINTYQNDYRFSRYLRSKTILHDYSGTTGSVFAGNASANFDDWQWAYKEGQLYDEDFRLITPIRLRVDSTLTHPDTLTPIRLRVGATYDDGTVELEALGDVTAASSLGESFHLTVIGYTIYEI